jgi:hypothetical protein
MNSSLEVSTAQVETNGHVTWMTFKTSIIELDVGIQDRLRVDPDLLHALNHGNCAKISQERIINLNVPAACLVQVGNFFTIRFRDIGEITAFIVICFLGESVVTMTEMEPFGSGLSSETHTQTNTIVILIYLTSSAGTFFARNSKAGT